MLTLEAPAPATACALFTSGRKPSGELVAALANFGLEPSAIVPAVSI